MTPRGRCHLQSWVWEATRGGRCSAEGVEGMGVCLSPVIYYAIKSKVRYINKGCEGFCVSQLRVCDGADALSRPGPEAGASGVTARAAFSCLCLRRAVARSHFPSAPRHRGGRRQGPSRQRGPPCLGTCCEGVRGLGGCVGSLPACDCVRSHPHGRGGCPGRQGALGGCSEELGLSPADFPRKQDVCHGTLCVPVHLTAPEPLGWSQPCVTAELAPMLTGDVPTRRCSDASCDTCSQAGEGDGEHRLRGTSQRARTPGTHRTKSVGTCGPVMGESFGRR